MSMRPLRVIAPLMLAVAPAAILSQRDDAIGLPREVSLAHVAQPTVADPGTDEARDEAISKLNAFLAKYPNSALRPNALMEVGELLVRQADENFANAQRAGGNVPDRPDYAAAIARYQELVKRYPNFPRADAAAYTLGALYFASNRFADASQMFELVTPKTTSTFAPEAFFRLGDTYFEQAARQKGEPRRALFAKAATAYESATKVAPRDGDIYYLSLYKLGWAYYNQASNKSQEQYKQGVDVFGRLVAEYDKLPPERQARLGLRGESIEYMAIAFTQVGGAEAANTYFAAHPEAGPFKLPLLRRVAVSLRDQGDFAKAVDAYRAVVAEAPNDSSNLATQQEIVDIYQNRVLEPESAQQARLELIDKFAPGTPWAMANPSLADSTAKVRENALRVSGQYAMSQAQFQKKDPVKTKARYAEAATLYGRYMTEFATSDSAQAVDFLYGEALFASGRFAEAGAQYSRAAYGFVKDSAKGQAKGDSKLRAQAGQDAIVAFDSALVHNKDDRATQDSLFTAVDRYVADSPNEDIARKALIEKGRRASESNRWDVVAETFRTYAQKFPGDKYTPTAQKLIGDALYKQGQYAEAQQQWESAQTFASKNGKKTLADSITKLRQAAAVSYADSLIKAGEYRRASEEVFVAYADRNATSDKAPDALRNAIETYMAGDSVARAKGDDKLSRQSRDRVIELTDRLTTQYPKYKYRAQYQNLEATLLADAGRKDEAAAVLTALIDQNPTWTGRADAMARVAVAYDSTGKKKEAAAAYERFTGAYPRDPRAADAQYNAAATYLEAGDTSAAARAYGAFASKFPKDARTSAAQQSRVALLRAAGDSASANGELARLCVKPSAELKTDCAERAARLEFRQGVELYDEYRPIRLRIPTTAQLTKAGVERATLRKRKLLTEMGTHFTKAIESGSPEWLAASSYYVGLAQYQYGNFMKNVVLPKGLTPEQTTAAQNAAAQQATQYYDAANKTWKALLDKAEQQKISNRWIDRAKAAMDGNVDEAPGR